MGVRVRVGVGVRVRVTCRVRARASFLSPTLMKLLRTVAGEMTDEVLPPNLQRMSVPVMETKEEPVTTTVVLPR